MWDIDLRVQGKSVFSGRVDPELLRGLFGDQAVVTVAPKSTLMTPEQAAELLERVSPD